MTVAGYIRVSTKDKQEINIQKDSINKYVSDYNLNIFDVYIDIGESGSKSSRPQWDRLISDMNNNKFDTLIIYKLDRIGRSIINLMSLFEIFEKKNIKIIVTTQNIDTTTPEGKLFRNILAIFAEYERQITISRVNDGLLSAKNRGVKLGRPLGKKDSIIRRKIGYLERWERERRMHTK